MLTITFKLFTITHVEWPRKLEAQCQCLAFAAREQHFSSDSPLDYYKKNIAIPFLDHISTHLAEQLSSIH